MEHPAITILNKHRIMAISTVRPDGWPQTTVVGYVNRGWDITFMIFRKGQKFANIAQNDHISIAVTEEPAEMSQLQAVYAGAHAHEITDEKEREEAWQLLMERHANLAGFVMPDSDEAVFLRATCKYVSMLDFTLGPGHHEEFTLDDSGTVIEGTRNHDGPGRPPTMPKEMVTMHGYCDDIEKRTTGNDAFRRVLYTGKNLQLVLMTLQPGEEIGEEVHSDRDQFFRFEGGEGAVFIDGAENRVSDNFAVIVPAGARHNVRNTGGGPLRLYTIYGPPEHIDGLVQETRAEAAETHEEWDGKTTEPI